MRAHLIIVFIACTLCFGGTVSAGELSFEQAVHLMNDQSIALQIAELNLQIANLDYDRAVASNLMTDSEYNRLQAEYNLARAQNTFKTAQDSNFLEVLKKYTEVLAAQRTLEIRRYENEIAKHNYKIVQEKVRIGDISRLDDLRELNKLESAQRAEETADNTLAESIRALKSALSLQDVAEVNLITAFALSEFSLQLDECLRIAQESNFDIWDREFSLELQEMQLQKSRIEGTAPIDLRRAELNLEIARLNNAKAYDELVERITSSFQALDQNRARYNSAERELQIAIESYEISERQAEIGLITEIQLLEARLGLLRAESSLQDALISYLISQIQFEQLLGLDVNSL